MPENRPLLEKSARKRFAVLGAVATLVAGFLVLHPPTAQAAGTLLSQGKPATASSTENTGTPAGAAVDGNTGTRWASAFADPQWLQVDLGSSQSISQVTLQWETARAATFKIQISANGTTWTDATPVTNGTDGVQNVTLTATARYVRMDGLTRTTQYGYSLWEFQVYGGTTTTACATGNSAQGHPATASSTENSGTPASSAVDGNTGTRWASAFADPQWLQVDLGSSQQVCGVDLNWETARAATFKIQISPDGTTWTDASPVTTGTDGVQTVTVNATGRYVRMYGLTRTTQYGYSLWEFVVHTVGGPTGPTTPPPGTCPWVGSTAPVADRVSQVLAAMTQTQKLAVLHGNGNASPYIGNLSPIPELCIPGLGLQDGPGGVGDGLGGVTQMPSAVTSAATFDTGLEQEYGAAAGAEFAGKGADVVLGPTLNIVRDPRWGRAFETFSEDPYLSGQMASANIRGIQSQGVMAQAKHAAVYNQETYRNGPQDNAIVDTRTLQEIYLPAFQDAVTKGATASIMCGYSTINGTFACQNPYILNTALYQQAGFGGFVTCDWGAMHSTVESANAGTTMEMPGGYFYADFLSQAVANGQVSQATLDTMVRRVLTQMFAFGLFDKTKTGSTTATVTTAAHQDVARRGAEEGTVLLKNNGILPLSTSSLSSVAVLGVDGGAGVQSVGGGSATATSSGTVWPLTGIQNRVAGTGVTVNYNDGTNIANAVALARTSSVAIVFASNNYGNEGTDQTTIDLPGSQNDLITQVAAANPKTIVVLHTNSATTMPWLANVAGVFEGFYGGQQVGTAIARLLFGDANPSGKLPVSFPKSLADVPASTTAQWPGNGTNVQYSEGLKVGYRWYDAQNITPLFPFGFGLSYTTYAFSNLVVGAMSGGQADVAATITNTGTRAGTEVAQLYVGAPAANGEPPRQLKNFQRVTLNPGQAQTIHFTVTSRDLAYWDTASSAWKTPAGAYQIMVGDSSRNLPLTGTLNAPAGLTAATASTLANPHGMSSPLGKAVSWQAVTGTGLTASGLPGGFTMTGSGLVTGAATSRGTSTVTIKAADGTSVAFVWTVT
jgi:beta-glucosidase